MANNNFAYYLFCKSISFIKKSKGPNMEPCGTPMNSGALVELVPLTLTFWGLHWYDCNQQSALFRTP